MRFVLALLAFLIPFGAQAQIISGKAIAVDGDSLEMSGARIRLFGIDAPEKGQTCRRDGADWSCGKDAADLLASLVDGLEITCERKATDTFSRIVAVCVAEGVDLGRVMIEAGFAVALPQFSDLYVPAESRARSLHLGIWNAEFQMPSDYRAAHRDQKRSRDGTAIPSRRPSAAGVASAAQPDSGGCVIKGNRNRKGEWIYHLPGMPYYDGTRPEEIFRTEAQARAAGYRRALTR
ncbi:thermonuclease family protein [Novosphingobium album (ex Liu et al. 2023)]|uniref:Thermonuclease family protein n=1 Tax=Novosphingobium album (ex Liu et al. 2023) TaxID=3031130 RepID=A0ABT5WQD8_9SPHN|nr:thermonuclease family protein [Novosphingobium album (ex Liu et al. 2023)]MDE8652253.1 thermonuclease family protein [Novosphingobium album (ex Liu et al. 2023)]